MIFQISKQNTFQYIFIHIKNKMILVNSIFWQKKKKNFYGNKYDNN